MEGWSEGRGGMGGRGEWRTARALLTAGTEPRDCQHARHMASREGQWKLYNL